MHETVDGKADFIDAEERRFAALECLATIQARSPEGMIAKAKAIQQRDVEYSNQFSAITASLADDVIQYLSRAA